MLLNKFHCWLGEASGGTGPVFRWVWALLILASGMGFLYTVRIALE
jgi:hypothetical protein